MASLPIEQRLLHYFMAMGGQQVEEDPSTAGLSFVLGDDKINVVVLNSDAYSQRSMVIDALLQLTPSRSASNLVYLAAPKLLGTSMDAAVFRSRGIGLLLYDGRRIEEAVTPERIEGQIQSVPDVHTQDRVLLAEIANLKSMYLEMEGTIAKLRQDLEDSRLSVGISVDPTRITQQQPVLAVEPGIGSQSPSSLPSFFANNPWLDLLSRRGKDEEAIAA